MKEIMDREFIPYEEALALKELGYDKGSCACIIGDGFNIFDGMVYYNINPKFPDYYDVPLYQQAFRWFREKHNLIVCNDYNNNEFFYWVVSSDDKYYFAPEDEDKNNIVCNNYEEVELESLKKLIEIVKNE